LEQEKFIKHYGSLYENSPHIALAIYESHRLDTLSPLEILSLMKDYVTKMDHESKMSLILEHPELGIKKGLQNNLTAHSKKEQNRAGLDSLSGSDFNLLSSLNKEYMNKFKFPFIIAVSGLNKEEVFRNIQVRLQNTVEKEFNTALEEIHKIAEIRLKNLQ
jgi:2-oxo-4-hydroxy-4-carboxy-5-ureidoimidazoline decarboxylase|tara:strand:- start:16 stop:498 length:483 start_codon:yes stop_codon:yes gene_type:complete